MALKKINSLNNSNMKIIKTFPDNQKFECLRCTDCCFDTQVELNKEEGKNIDKRYLNKIKSSYGKYALKHKLNNECCFLEGKKCNIYPKRPNVCKEFPFKVIFTDKDTAYVDVIYRCPAILLNKGEKLDIDLGNIVKNNLYQIKKMPEIRLDMDKLIIDFDEKIKKADGDLFIYNPDEGWQAYMGKLLGVIANSKINHIGRDFKLDKRFIIEFGDGSVSFVFDDHMIVQPLKMITKMKKTKKAIKKLDDYLLKIWKRRSTQADTYMFSKYHKKNVIEVFKQASIRILMLLELMMHLMALKNYHAEIDDSDVLEAIYIVDEYALLPGRMIRT